MADPFSIIGVTAALIDLTIYAAKVVRIAHNIYESTESTENGKLEDTINNLSNLMDNVKRASDAQRDAPVLDLVVHCKDLGQRLLDLLNKTKPKVENSKTSSLKAAIKTVWHDKDIKELEIKLDHCTSQLNLYIQVAFRSETARKMEDILDGNRSAIKDLLRLKETVDAARIDQQNTLMTLEEVRSLLRVSETHLIAANQQRILDGIQFEDMDARFESISQTSENTFRWCIEDSKLPYSHPALKISFRDWLAKGSGVYHIAGKPGAGKSTLMKFLAEHSETKSQLKQWAGVFRTLITASFYFWKAGHQQQRNLEGLIRSMAYTVFGKLPDLIPSVFKDYWEPGRLSMWMKMGYDKKSKIPFNHVFAALDSVLKQKVGLDDVAFCFFIDGLDEFQDPNKKQSDLARDLCAWTVANPAGLKICVSSRQEIAFMGNFPEDQRLYLHLITKHDMELAAQNFLSKHPRFCSETEESKTHLVREIVSRSDGVFLWVKSALDELWEALDEQQNFTDLHERLATFPNELEAFFGYMLKSIRSSSQKDAWAVLTIVYAQTQMLAATLEDETGFLYLPKCPLHLYTFLGDYFKDNNFGTKMVKSAALSHEQVTRDTDTRCRVFSDRLGSLCKGLVEATGGSVSEISFWSLNFTHRSVFDYLQSDSIPNEFGEFQRNFDIDSFITQSSIAFSLKSADSVPGLTIDNRGFSWVFEWMNKRAKHLTQKHYKQLDLLNFTHLNCYLNGADVEMFRWDLSELIAIYCSMADPTDKLLSYTNQSCPYHILRKFCRFISGNYLSWLLRNHPELSSDTESVAKLFGEEMLSFGRGHPKADILAVLVEQPFFTPSFAVDYDKGGSRVSPKVTWKRAGILQPPEKMPAWIAFVIGGFFGRSEWAAEWDTDTWNLWKLCLQSDDGNFPINFYWRITVNDQGFPEVIYIESPSSSEEEQYELSWNVQTRSKSKLRYHFLGVEVWSIQKYRRDDSLRIGKSFRWLIEQVKREDKEEMLALIDRNIQLTQSRQQKLGEMSESKESVIGELEQQAAKIEKDTLIKETQEEPIEDSPNVNEEPMTDRSRTFTVSTEQEDMKQDARSTTRPPPSQPTTYFRTDLVLSGLALIALCVAATHFVRSGRRARRR